MLKHTMIVTAALLAAASSAGAADTLKIRVADAFPTSHVISVAGARFWMDRVTAQVGGKVTFEYYPAQQLGKAPDFLRLLQSGVVDVAYVAPAYVTDKMPLSDVAMLPGMFKDVCTGSKAYWTLATTGILASAEYKPNGIVPLFAAAMPPYQIVSTRHPIAALANLKGLKIRSSGGSSDLTIRALGAVPIKITGPETREGLDRGTLDANLGPHSSLKSYDIYPLAKFGTVGAPLGSFIVTYSMQRRKWEALSPEIRSAFEKAGRETNEHLCKALEDENTAAIGDMTKLGTKFYTVSDEDRASFMRKTSKIDQEWARGIDDRKKPGSQALAEFKRAIGQ